MEQFLFGTAYDAQNPDDIVYTPLDVAKELAMRLFGNFCNDIDIKDGNYA